MASQDVEATELVTSSATPEDRSLAHYSAKPRNTTVKRNVPKVLPFDVLFLIFDEYLLNETPAHPVETLLLVCKYWSQAALHHPGLWSAFNIKSPDYTFWAACIPRRLGRCPANTPLDIRIRNSSIQYWWPEDVVHAQKQGCKDTMSHLTGHDGELARRWRTLTVNGELSDSPDESICHHLRYSTPNLIRFTVSDVHFVSPMLADALSLKFISLLYTRTPSLPNLSHTLELAIGTRNAALAEPALAKAKQLISLRIVEDSRMEYGLSTEHLHLTSLHLARDLRPGGLEAFSAPALENISLNFRIGSEFLSVISCKGIDLKQIRVVSLQIVDEEERPDQDYYEGLSNFLRTTNNSRILELQTGLVAQFVLGTLTSQNHFLYRDHDVILRIDNCDIELPRGEERWDMSSTLNNAINAQYRDFLWGVFDRPISFYLPKGWKYMLHVPK